MGLLYKLKNTLSSFGIFEKRIAPEQDANGDAAMNDGAGDDLDPEDHTLDQEEVRIVIH